jgi:hypothetical protein
MTAVRLTERLTVPRGDALTGDNVDIAAGVLKNVVLCGFKSANGREYPRAVLESRLAKYEGAKANLNHAVNGRVFQEWIGVIRNVRKGDDGRPRGNVVLFKSDPHTPKILEAAQTCPDKFGMSHVALCRTSRRADGVEVVEDIEAVESVDIVVDPATVDGLFEDKGAAVGKVSLKRFVELRGPKWGPQKWAAAAKLCEDFPAYADVPAVDEPAADAEEKPGDLKAALMAALEPMLDEAFDSGDPAKLIAALKDFIKLHAKHTGKGGGETEPETEESKRRKPDAAALTREALDVCRKVGFKGFDATDLDIISAAPTAEREAVAKRLMGAGGGTGGETPTSGGRHQFAEHRDEKDAAKRLAEERAGKKDEPVISWD